MNVEERIQKAERKIATVEDAIKLLSQLVTNHDERLVDSLKGREDSDAKINMLIDSQIQTDDKINVLIDSQKRSDDKINSINQVLDKLTELVKASHSRIDGLENQR
jgi:chromosome segregation ATPase